MPRAMTGKELQLPAQALVFANEFVHRMREHPGLPLATDPSPRQAIAIPSVLMSRWMRRGALTDEDFIVAAVSTSYVDNQEIARRIAAEIIAEARGGEPEEPAGELRVAERLSRKGELKPAPEQGADGPTREQKEAGLFAGAGEENFYEWADLFRGNKDYRRRVYDMADRIRFSCRSSSEFMSLAAEESGILDGEGLAFFQDGMDPSMVDFEESLESILSQGKALAELSLEDLVVRQRRGQRKAIVFLEDVSGSIGTSLKYSVLCMVILLYAFRKHTLAVAFFEGNPYVLREFGENEPIEETIEKVLAARTMYGTMGGRVLEWARESLAGIEGRYHDKLCVICSDMGFHDIERVVAEIRKMKREGVEVVAVAPPGFVHRPRLEAIREAGAIAVELDHANMERFPEEVSTAFTLLGA